MLDPHDIIPKYLTSETTKELIESLSAFPENIDKRLYSSANIDPELLCQGDGIDDLLVVEVPSLRTKRAPCMILSNTCDIDPSNEHIFSTNIIYSPIIRLEAYRNFLTSEGICTDQVLDDHLKAIRSQHVTQIFYLPKLSATIEEGIVFYDRLVSCASDAVDRPSLSMKRLFTLSQYGHYLFLLKLSIHFTRMSEGIDRG
jgi:hypothetical protein